MAFCKKPVIDINDICSKGKNSIRRAFLMELLYRHCKITQPEIGRLTDGIDYSAVNYTRKRLRLKTEKDLVLKQRFEAIKSEMSRLRICPLFGYHITVRWL